MVFVEGIKSEVLKCIWHYGMPSKGHLQEAVHAGQQHQETPRPVEPEKEEEPVRPTEPQETEVKQKQPQLEPEQQQKQPQPQEQQKSVQ